MRRDAVAIVAMADNGMIGRGHGLPWHLPDDLKRFKALTMGHAMLMGRKTWDSIGRPLPGRRSLVLTRNAAWHAPGAERVASLAEAPVLVPPDLPDGDLWARVAALPQRQRDAVVLRFVGDLDHGAVATALGTSPGMSRRLVSDAIATLRLDLRDQP